MPTGCNNFQEMQTKSQKSITRRLGQLNNSSYSTNWRWF